MSVSTKPRTIIEKIWDNHVVAERPDAPALLYIDLHLVHEVTSPQPFDGLRARGLKVRRPDLTIATTDHSTPTTPRGLPIVDKIAATQVEKLNQNCKDFGIHCYPLGSDKQGIVHVIGPELGLTQPGMTVVCGDSHTATHGAFGALAFGIGTSEVEHVLATQCLLQRPSKTYHGARGWRAEAGRFGEGHYSGADRADRHRRRHGLRVRILRLGDSVALDGRAHDGVQHVDRRRRARGIGRAGRHDVSIRRRPAVCAEGRGRGMQAVARWRQLPTDDGATYDKSITIDATSLEPMITFGTNPGMGIPIRGAVPESERHYRSAGARFAREGAALHGSAGGQAAAGASGECGVHRKLHQFANLGSAHRGERAEGPQGESECARAWWCRGRSR